MNILKYTKWIPYLLVLNLLMACEAKTSEDAKTEEAESSPKKSVTLVKVQDLKPETFRQFVNLQANVEAVQQVVISPEVGGQVTQILVQDGQRVRKGTLLIKLNTAVVEGQIASVRSQLSLAEITYNKQKDLWLNQQIGSEIQYLQAKTQYESLREQLKTLEAQLNMSSLKAPFDGIVDKVNIKKGELATPGRPMIQFVNLSKIKLTGDLSEIYLPSVKKGDSVSVSFTTYPDYHLKSTVYRTGNIINPNNRTFEIEVRVKNTDERLKPNMVSVIKIEDYNLENAVVIPSIIIKKDFEREFVFVAERTDSGFVARKRFVESGKSFEDKTIITKGLSFGEKVIVVGYNLISNGTNIQINH